MTTSVKRSQRRTDELLIAVVVSNGHWQGWKTGFVGFVFGG